MARSRRRSEGELTDRARKALTLFDETTKGHDDLVTEYERRYRAYRGVVDQRKESLPWTSKATPPYAQHIIETAVTTLIEDRMRFRVKPRPKFYEPDELELVKRGAQAHEWLLTWQLDQNRFHEKQRTLVLQERLAGMTVAKLRWRSDVRMRSRLQLRERTIEDEFGGYMGSFPILEEEPRQEVIYDGPDIEPVDVRDFFWDMSAINWDRNEIAAHRVWMTPEELKAMSAQDLPAEVRWKGTDKLTDTRDFAGMYSPRTLMTEQERKRGRVEVLEVWLKESGKVRIYTIANRSVLLNERDSPYHHGEFPFVVISTQQDLFRIGGISQIEKIEELQSQLWTISNLRTDAVMLATMPIILLQEGMDDPLKFDFRPYARNLVSQPKEVNMWAPDAQATQVSLPTEANIKADMQNLTGGFPFTSATEARTVGANTATEANLTANLAQRALVTAKTFLNYGYERLGQQMMLLNQQYVRDPVYVTVLDLDEEFEQQEILPEMLRGDFDFTIEPVSELLMRNERRAEATTLFQMLVQSAQIFAMTGQPLNMRRILEDVLEAFDKKDVAPYLFSQPQPQAAQGGPQQGQGMGSPPGITPMPNPNGGGQTSPLASGPGSPSNEFSLSPEASMQQFGASSGGGRAV